MITTTLNRIRALKPCGIDPRKTPLTGYQKLKAGLGAGWGDDDPIPFARILEINNLDDGLWCCRAEPQYAPEWRLFAVWCARQVQHLITDPHGIAALDVSERYANGQATMAELKAAAWPAAWSAACSAADAAADAATWASADAAAWTAAWAAANAAADTAAWAAADAAAWSATEEDAAADAAACSPEWAAARADQTAKFLRIVNETEART